ncbi:hypothetical protein [Pseudomonas rhodesiae]|uniref:hypothetical protein n=1 Tax=Pseudomonas rhodesiae TaxID=76760 RepID=UPI00289685CA|nr:hypothetical protein [Pseudomonas rhodesiae]
MKRLLKYWESQAKWWSSQSLEWWGAHFTALYIGGAIMIISSRFDEIFTLGLNEIGDLLAGVFGPVAFLWLVLGYRQQGRELKLSSQSLTDQTVELRNSVENQKALAAISERQLLLNEKNAQLQNEQLSASVEPRFVLAFEDLDVRYSPPKHLVRLLNAGHGITCVECDFNGVKKWKYDQIESQQSKSFEIDRQMISEINGERMEFKVVYLNGIQKKSEALFNITIKHVSSGREFDRFVYPPNGLRFEIND